MHTYTHARTRNKCSKIELFFEKKYNRSWVRRFLVYQLLFQQHWIYRQIVYFRHLFHLHNTVFFFVFVLNFTSTRENKKAPVAQTHTLTANQVDKLFRVFSSCVCVSERGFFLIHWRTDIQYNSRRNIHTQLIIDSIQITLIIFCFENCLSLSFSHLYTCLRLLIVLLRILYR